MVYCYQFQIIIVEVIAGFIIKKAIESYFIIATITIIIYFNFIMDLIIFMEIKLFINFVKIIFIWVNKIIFQAIIIVAQIIQYSNLNYYYYLLCFLLLSSYHYYHFIIIFINFIENFLIIGFNYLFIFKFLCLLLLFLHLFLLYFLLQFLFFQLLQLVKINFTIMIKIIVEIAIFKTNFRNLAIKINAINFNFNLVEINFIFIASC